MLPPEFQPAGAVSSAVRQAVDAYRAHADVPRLLEALDEVARHATPEALAEAVEPFRDIPRWPARCTSGSWPSVPPTRARS
jgi:hypothetical protein